MSDRIERSPTAPEADIVEVRASHHRLLRTVEGLDDLAVAGPSRLPGWTVGMVVTHLARHADGQAAVLRDEASARYPSVDARNAAIDAGRGATAGAVLADLGGAITRLDAAYRDAEWTGAGERLPGVDHEPFGIYPFQRWREVEVHHADLGVGYSSADWPESLAARWLPETLATLPERTDQRQLLAWALGRSDAAPPLQAWR